MPAFDSSAFSTDAFSSDAFDIAVQTVPEEAGTTIENLTATIDAKNRYEICDRTGFKAKPGTLKETWDGLMVLPSQWEPRNFQDRIRSRPESQDGANRPEPIGTETFITTPVDPDDL